MENSSIALIVSYIALGCVLLYQTTRPESKKPEYTSLGNDPLTRDFTKPRIDRGRVLGASLYILTGLLGLVLFVAEHWKRR